ncbi:MAG: shikimate dehydrogenase [Bauldia sp.]|nr:shikimate dehydrogenase [Bauldia sp.]
MTTSQAPRLEAATRPTLYFIGVTTARSSILRVFPRWAETLGLADARIVGVDLPLHAPAEDYRSVVCFIKDDPLSRGALVTTHKIDLLEACRDLFDEIDDLAKLTGELSCLSKRDGRLIGTAKDPITGGLALDSFLPAGHFAQSKAEAFFIGAGGAAIAITWSLMRAERGADRPSRIVVSDRERSRLDAIAHHHRDFGFDTPVAYVLAAAAADNDRVMAGLPAGSLVVNATGLGKDAPGSPITDAAVFPRDGFAWELNYRGDLVFLDQARRAAERQPLTVTDGWVYFLHGWTRVIAEVFDIDIPTSGPDFERLSEIAASA